MSRQRHCNLHAWAIATSGDGAGAEKVEDLPSVIVKFSFVVVFVVAESYDDDK